MTNRRWNISEYHKITIDKISYNKLRMVIIIIISYIEVHAIQIEYVNITIYNFELF